MASSLGIRIGPRRFEIVALEGSAKKPRIAASTWGEIPGDVDDVIGATTAAIKRAVGEMKRVKADEVALSMDAGHAAFRTLTLPFDDKAKIEQVIKFEVESQLPQWDIDDVVVDFEVLNSTGVESQLLVTAVPKDDVWGGLQAVEKAGYEAQEAELECHSIVNAAHAVGAFGVDSSEVLIHVGENSTSLIVVDGGALRSMRALHVGGFVPTNTPTPVAPVVDEDGAEGEDAEGGERAPEPAPAPPPVSEADQRKRLEEAAVRLRREIARTVTGLQTANPLGAIYLCGAELPGLVGESVEDVLIERLDVIPEEAGDVVGDRGIYAAAYGAALGRLGSQLVTPHLRREELRYSGKFERLELPLAVLFLLVLALIGVRWIVVMEETDRREKDLVTWLEGSNNFMLGDIASGGAANLKFPPEELQEFAESREEQIREGTRPRAEAWDTLRGIDTRLDGYIRQNEKQLGSDSNFDQPLSALRAATLVLGVLEELGPERTGRFHIRALKSDYRRGQGTRGDRVEVTIDLSFYADDGDSVSDVTGHYLAFYNSCREKPWCLEFERQQVTPLDPAAGVEGVYVDNISIAVDPTRVAPIPGEED